MAKQIKMLPYVTPQLSIFTAYINIFVILHNFVKELSQFFKNNQQQYCNDLAYLARMLNSLRPPCKSCILTILPPHKADSDLD
jgi:hypothetical protein